MFSGFSWLNGGGARESIIENLKDKINKFINDDTPHAWMARHSSCH